MKKRITLILKKCLHCNKEFYVIPQRIKTAKYCSKKCFDDIRRYKEIKSPEEKKKYLDNKGYLVFCYFIWKNGKPIKKEKRWSRYLMEKKIGKLLTKNDYVHHINGIKTDDRIENLELTTPRKHAKLHKLGGSYKKWGEK